MLAHCSMTQKCTFAWLPCLQLPGLLLTLRPLLIVGAVAAASFTCDSQADAQSSQNPEAREAFGAGVKYYADGEYARALIAFQKAYSLKPHPAVKVNIANCYERLDKPVHALVAFQSYLRSEEGAVPSKKRNDVEEAVRRLSQQVSRIDIKPNPEDAQVDVDGKRPLRSPQGELLVMPGRHTLRVSREGFGPETRIVNVAAGESLALLVELVPSQVPGLWQVPSREAAPQDDEREEEEKKSRFTTPVLLAGGVTAGLTVGALVTGLLAVSSNSDFEEALDDAQAPNASAQERAEARERGLDAADRTETLTTVTDVLIGGAIVGAAATAILLISNTGADSGDDDVSGDQASLRLTPSATQSGGGLLLQARF